LKTIDSLIEDIHKVLMEGVEEIPSEVLDAFSSSIADIVKTRLTKPREHEPALRFSNMGSPCERKLWYAINRADEGGELSPDTKLKFMFGDVVEQLLILLAKVSGHRVEGQQTEFDFHGIKGHRDLVLDGVVTDCKSASSFSYKKFKEHTLKDDDAFGYIPQLMGYLEASQDDPIVTDKSRAAFLAFDKSLGHICLDFHTRPDWDWEHIIEYKKSIVNAESPPGRGFEPEDFGKSGNKKLGSFCSYCSFKELCYPELRTFIYSTGPVYMTETVVTPAVYEKVKNATDTGGT
jgi:hypothetical protein